MNTDYKYEPNNGFTKWLDKRLPLMRFTSEHVLQFPTPKNLNYFWTFGFILTMCLVTQIITGIILAMHYAPSTLLAFDSVEHIMRNVNYGWLIRYIHSNGASMFFLAVFIHMFRGLYYGSYKEPREVIWILGCIIYLLMIVTELETDETSEFMEFANETEKAILTASVYNLSTHGNTEIIAQRWNQSSISCIINNISS